MNLFKEMFNDFVQSLSENEQTIFNFISSNIFIVSEMSLKQLSLSLDMSEYSINKFCKKLNIDNYENLTSILKQFSQTTQTQRTNMFNISKDSLHNFLNNLPEYKINMICESIMQTKEISIIFSEESKLVAQYFEDILNKLDFKVTITSSFKPNSKNKNTPLIMYITNNINESELKSSIEKFSNKTIIILSDKMTKEISNLSYVFVDLPNNKIIKNYNINSIGNYFILIDLITSKLMESTNIKI